MAPMEDGSLNHSLSRLPSCQADLQELLQQIDMMVSHRLQMWQSQTQELKVQLRTREAELMRTQMQVRSLKQQMEERAHAQRDATDRYHDSLGWLRSELQRLKDSYQRLTLQRAARDRQASTSLETTVPSGRPQDLQGMAREWEEQKASSQKALAVLEASRRSAVSRCSRLLQVSSAKQEQLPSKFTELQARLEEAREELHAMGAANVQLKEDIETRRKEHDVEKQRLQQELELMQQQYQRSEEELREVRAGLQCRDGLLRATELEKRKWQEEAVRLQERLLDSEKNGRLEGEGAQREAVAGILWLKVQMEKVLRALMSGSHREALLSEDITSLQAGLESSHVATAQLGGAPWRPDDEFRAQEHAGVLESQDKLAVPPLENSGSVTPKALAVHGWVEMSAKNYDTDAANHRAVEYQVAQNQLQSLNLENVELREPLSHMESKGAVLEYVTAPPAGDMAGHPESRGMRLPSPGDHSVITHEGWLSPYWEQAKTRDAPSFSGSAVMPAELCHGNRHKGEESATELGVATSTSACMKAGLRSMMVDNFLQEEDRRMKILEQQLDSYERKLHSNIQGTLQRCGLSCPGNVRALPSPPRRLLQPPPVVHLQLQ